MWTNHSFNTISIMLSVSLGVGFFMQFGQDASAGSGAQVGQAELKAVRMLMMSTNDEGESVFGLPDVIISPISHFENVQAVVAVDAVYAEVSVPQMGTISATPIEGCAATLTAAAEDAAMVSLYLMAPCETDAVFVLRHDAFAFTGRTDDEGHTFLVVPALAVDATYAVLFDNVEMVRTTVSVPDVRIYDRVILQWNGNYNLQLHALEGGAVIGDPGHVWSASMHTAEDAIAGEQGFVVRFGTLDADIPRLAEVYTYQANQGRSEIPTVLQFGVVVTDTNCGREVDTTTIQTNIDGAPKIRQLGAALPGCDAVGQVTMLRDKFGDITLASR
jgi:hypothetical protein